MAIAGDLNGQFAEVALEGLPALAVAGVASGIGHRLVAFMAQVLSQLSVQGSLDQQLGQLLEQTVLADEVFGLLVVGQQARQQFFGYVVFLGAHCAYGQAGLRRRLIVRLHKILHTLQTEGARSWREVRAAQSATATPSTAPPGSSRRETPLCACAACSGSLGHAAILPVVPRSCHSGLTGAMSQA